MARETLFENALFHTMERPDSHARALLVRGDTVVALNEDAVAIAGPRTRHVDLGGLHVWPALTDSHLHLLDAIALQAIGSNVCRFENGRVEPHNLAGVEPVVRTAVAFAGPDELVVLQGYISMCMDEDRLPNRFELDEWGDGRPLWVMNMDGHSSSCSTALLRACGLEGEAPDGILTGPAHDANIGALTSQIARCITPAILARGIASFCNMCAGFGIGTVCALDGTDDLERDPLCELTAVLASRLPIDVRLFPQYMDDAKLGRVLSRMGRKRVGGCMKWELDGSVGSSTAAFSEPYLNGKMGSLYFPDHEICDTVERYLKDGFTVTAHAIGELAINQLLDAYEGALEKDLVRGEDGRVLQAGDPALARRLRIDHCEFPAEGDVPRICRLGASVTVQPGYAWIDKQFMHGYERQLPARAVSQQVPLRTLDAAGVLLLGSSDAPVQSVDPFLQMRGMREFYVGKESLGAYEALRTYTVNAGLALGERKGLLAPGYEASFFTTTEDLLAIDPAGLEGMRAQSTWLHGKEWKPLSGGMGTLARLLASIPHKI